MKKIAIAKDAVELMSGIVEKHTNITKAQLLGKARPEYIVLRRFMACKIVSLHTWFSLEEIGRAFGGRDHSAILYATNRADEMLERSNDSNASRRFKSEFSAMETEFLKHAIITRECQEQVSNLRAQMNRMRANFETRFIVPIDSLAADLADRIPGMALDSRCNNAQFIAAHIRNHLRA